jgi:hypothetical protein
MLIVIALLENIRGRESYAGRLHLVQSKMTAPGTVSG